ncbi:nucleotidyltransferase family protein [Aerophototrophica crusticola]|uniref:nucleotidyltransferase family protein n=1 Tax=Aerophototrophica crusticola TaxID=1709002 RepID=UPI00384DC0CA
MRVMGDAHQFAYLCVHGARHEWSRLQWVCDLDRMLRAKPDDAGSWLATADRLGVGGPVIQGMVFANALLGSPIPDAARARAEQVASVRYLLAHGAQHLFRRQRKPERRSGDPRTSATLYMMCLSPRPAYLAFEFSSRVREFGKEVLPRRVARTIGAG